MDLKRIRDVLKTHYGLKPIAIRCLQGYEVGTVLLSGTGDPLILKYYPRSDSRTQWLAEENRILQHLALNHKGRFPEVYPTLDGSMDVHANGTHYRILTFLDGDFLAEASQTPGLLTSFGAFMGRLSKTLVKVKPGTLASAESEWDLQHLLKNRQFLTRVKDKRDRALIDYFFLQFEREVLPYRYHLRKAVIHNDANDWNVLCDGREVSSLIDFGDICYSWQINEVAVALTYILMGKDDPLSAAEVFLRAYHAEFPLTQEESDVLYYLVAGRLCMSLCQSAQTIEAAGTSLTPEQETYINISKVPAQKLLHQWIRINPLKARNAFRSAIGVPEPAPGLRKDLMERRSRFFSPALSLSYNTPIAMQRAAMQYMYDVSGNTYLDAYNNIMLAGHSHPKVARAASEGMARLNTNTRYLYNALDEYAEQLLALFPEPLNKLFLVNSGSAATDLALRLARYGTGRRKMLVLSQGYHGNTSAGIAVSHYKHVKKDLFPDTLIGPFPGTADGNTLGGGEQSRRCIRAYLDLVQSHAGTLAGFIAEPIMGCGGQLPLPEGLLPEVYGEIRKQGGVCISDEVQVGFGRLGKWTWGFQMRGLVPDIVVLGKPMGNGHPIGGVVTTAAIADAFAEGPEFFSSFGGNPVSCAIGKAVLDVIEEEGLREHAEKTGRILLRELENLQGHHTAITEVRGSGLFVGLALADREGKPDAAGASHLCNALKDRRILTSTDGPMNNVLKIKPPLPFDALNTSQLCTEIDRILKQTGSSC